MDMNYKSWYDKTDLTIQKKIFHWRRMRKTNLSLKCHCKKENCYSFAHQSETRKSKSPLVGLRKFSFKLKMNTHQCKKQCSTFTRFLMFCSSSFLPSKMSPLNRNEEYFSFIRCEGKIEWSFAPRNDKLHTNLNRD